MAAALTGAAPPAYWSRAIGEAGTPLLKRTCPWPVSTQWRRQYLLVHSALKDLTSPLLIPPQNGSRAFRGTFLVPEENWLSVPAREFHTRWTVPQIDRIMLDIASAVSLLNSVNVLALNLSPANVLIDASGEEPRAALSDLSTFLPLKLLVEIRHAFLSMPDYTAPEVRVSAAEGGPLTPDFSADVFSLGLLYHVYLIGTLPAFDETSAAKNGSEIPAGRAQLSRRLDQPHKMLLERLLETSPERRMASVSAVVPEINSLLRSGDCHIELIWPNHEGKTLTLSTPDGYVARKRISADGTAVFGPLLSSAQYTLSCRGTTVACLSFPSSESGQRLSLSVPELMSRRFEDSADVQNPATPIPREPEKPPEEPYRPAIVLNPPVNHIRRIEPLSERYCRLTLINGGTMRIRTMDAARFGLEHILNSGAGE